MQEATDTQPETRDTEFTHEEWGDGNIVSHWGEGKWVMYDPESDTVTLDNMR